MPITERAECHGHCQRIALFFGARSVTYPRTVRASGTRPQTCPPTPTQRRRAQVIRLPIDLGTNQRGGRQKIASVRTKTGGRQYKRHKAPNREENGSEAAAPTQAPNSPKVKLGRFGRTKPK